MRIRKRQVPLPLSSLVPVPLSDLYSNRSAVVQPPVRSIGSSQPSDHHPDRPIGGGSNGCDLSDHTGKALKEEGKDNDGLAKEEREKKEEDPDDISNNSYWSLLDSKQISSSPQVVPLKKRKGTSLEEDKTANGEDKRIMNEKMKMKIVNKNGSEQDDSSTSSHNNIQEQKNEAQDTSFVDDHNNVITGKGKKKARGGVLMEGSRCSRVNGRGWRCCQPTLVGYSLCEHHLGKGRLRSMMSVRSRSNNNNKNSNTQKKKEGTDDHHDLSLQEKRDDDDDDDDDDERKISMDSTKKRVKLGIVKARSISSLLGQTSNDLVALADDK